MPVRLDKIPKDQLLISMIKENGEKVALDDKSKTLLDVGAANETKIQIKNLGKQIKWEYVFYI